MKEIAYVLQHTDDERIMRDMFLRMSIDDVFKVFNITEFLDRETEERWLRVYNNLSKNT